MKKNEARTMPGMIVSHCRKLAVVFAALGLPLLVPLRATATLTVTNDLAVWLQASALTNTISNGQAVGTWTDSSPNNRNYTQATNSFRPTMVTTDVHGNPGVRFDGADDYLLLSPIVKNPAAGGFTYFAVMETSFNDTSSFYTGNAPQTIFGSSDGQVNKGFGINGGQFEYNHYQGVWQHFDATNSLNNGTWHILGLTHDFSGAVKMYVDGNLVLSGSSTYNFTGYTAFNFLQDLGGGYTNSTSSAADFFHGDLAEVLAYTNALTSSDVQLVNNYLVDEYLSIPEPSVVLLAFVGAAVAGLARRRRKNE